MISLLWLWNRVLSGLGVCVLVVCVLFRCEWIYRFIGVISKLRKNGIC